MVLNILFVAADSFSNEEFEKEILLFKTETFSDAFVLDSFSVVVNVSIVDSFTKAIDPQD